MCVVCYCVYSVFPKERSLPLLGVVFVWYVRFDCRVAVFLVCMLALVFECVLA